MTAKTKELATDLHKVYKKLAKSASFPLVLRPYAEGQAGKIIFKVASFSDAKAVEKFAQDAKQIVKVQEKFEDIDVYNEEGELIDVVDGKLLGYEITITV